MANIKKEKQKLLATISAYAELAAKKGIVVAAGQYLVEDAVMLVAESAPINGRDAICKHLTPLAKARLTWAPYYVDLASSGDLAYTLGSWQIQGTDESAQEPAGTGNYVTIWRKQSNGEWRCVFDAGYTGPPPSAS
jgi:ketosteroid isomerase-like protein